MNTLEFCEKNAVSTKLLSIISQTIPEEENNILLLHIDTHLPNYTCDITAKHNVDNHHHTNLSSLTNSWASIFESHMISTHSVYIENECLFDTVKAVVFLCI